MQQSNSADNQQVSEVEKAWLAGIIDGEGCITISMVPRPKVQKKYYTPVVDIANICPILMAKVIDIINKIGCGKYISMRRFEPNRGKRRTAIDVRVMGLMRVPKLLVAVLPYLVSKQEEALITIRFCQMRLLADSPAPKHAIPYTEEEMELYSRVRKIKELRHLREHTPDLTKTVEKMCSELHSDMQRIAEMPIPYRIKGKY